ncbi:hypothetical protein PULV_a1510 [Pseudoalteromonas ulvae UL12]|nr:hypothetical protein [Pseudoalteromonas ulvae UL12]
MTAYYLLFSKIFCVTSEQHGCPLYLWRVKINQTTMSGPNFYRQNI